MKEQQFQKVAKRLGALQTKNQNLQISNLSHDLKNITLEPGPKKHCQCGNEIERGQSRCGKCYSRDKAEYDRHVLRSHRKVRVQNIKKRIETDIPKLYQSATISNLSSEIQKIVKTSYESGLYLWGGVGIGKTYTATVIWRRYIASEKTVIRKTYREIMINLRSGFNSDTPESFIIGQYTECQILIIEDLAACKSSEYAQESILHIIDSRMENCKPTIITGNISPENLASILGERFSSRLRTYLIVKLGGDDKRKTGVAKSRL